MTDSVNTTAVLVLDPAVQSAPYASVEAIDDPGFRAFVTTIVEDGGWAIAPDPLVGGEASVRIIRSPLVLSGDRPVTDGPVTNAASQGDCTIVSPWFNLVVARGSARVAGTIRWNERQIVRDRAAIAGATLPAGGAEPLARTAFDGMAQGYADHLTASPGRSDPPTMPAELLWLFRQVPQSTFGPFADAAEDAVARITAPTATYYARLAGALIERCRSGGEATLVVPDIGAAKRMAPSVKA